MRLPMWHDKVVGHPIIPRVHIATGPVAAAAP